MTTEHPINAPFLSKDTNHIESFESFQYKKLVNYNNRKNIIKSFKQSHILSDYWLNFSQKTSEVCVSHVFEHISIIHLLSIFKNKSENCVLCLLNSWSKQVWIVNTLTAIFLVIWGRVQVKQFFKWEKGSLFFLLG
jgi:hypothetical protein